MEQLIKTVCGALLAGVGTTFTIVGTTVLRDSAKDYSGLLTELTGKLFKGGA